MKNTFHKSLRALLVLFLACGAFLQAGLNLSDLRLPLDRDAADKYVNKEYTYKVMDDSTVRREWDCSGSKVYADFDPGSGKLLCVVVEYDKPASPQAWKKDARALTGNKAKGCKWRRTKSAAVANYGMKLAMVMKLTDGSFLFRECRGKKGNAEKQTVRLSLFPSMPSKDRFSLPVSDGMERKTAMGSSGSSGAYKFLMQDEARRMKLPLQTRPTAAVAATTPSGKKPAAAEPVEEVEEDVFDAVEAEPAVADTTAPAAEKPDFITRLMDFNNIGKEHYVVGGILGALVLIILISAIRNSCRRSRLRKQAQAIIDGKQQN